MRAQPGTLRVCYVLSYYFPQYVRTKTLIDALRRISGVEVFEATNQCSGVLRYAETLLKLIWIRTKHHPDCYVLGFRGYEIFWPVRLITLGHRLIVDHLMSPYDSLVHETGRLKPGSLIAKVTYLYERAVLHSADTILTDTPAHRRHFARLFRVTEAKMYAVPVSADESLFHSEVVIPGEDPRPFLVLFYGSFLPLHGVDVILRAAEYLQTWAISFVLIGGGRRGAARFRLRIKEMGLPNVTHIQWVEYEELPRWIAEADLCLGGPFGATGQGKRVVTGKTLQCLAMAKPTVVGKTEEDYGFRHQENCLLVPQGDATALADAVLWAFGHRGECRSIGSRGHCLYLDRFSVDCLSVELARVLMADVTV